MSSYLDAASLGLEGLGDAPRTATAPGMGLHSDPPRRASCGLSIVLELELRRFGQCQVVYLSHFTKCNPHLRKEPYFAGAEN